MHTWKGWCHEFFLKNKKPCIIATALLFIFLFIALYFIGGRGDNKIMLEHGGDDLNSSKGESETISENLNENEVLVVDIAGQVVNPAVYILPAGSRLYEAIEMAGGLTEAADTRNTNLAEFVLDSSKIYIPSEKELELEVTKALEEKSGLININTADSSQLQRLTGVGPSTAEKIINYRKEYGGFKTIEDIKNVSGIGEKTFEKLKNLIVVE